MLVTLGPAGHGSSCFSYDERVPGACFGFTGVQVGYSAHS